MKWNQACKNESRPRRVIGFVKYRYDFFFEIQSFEALRGLSMLVYDSMINMIGRAGPRYIWYIPFWTRCSRLVYLISGA